MAEDFPNAHGPAREPDLTSEQQVATPPDPLLVVGIGGSAGALDGYERFFLGLPPGSGMAFVVVAHLDPKHQGLMPSVLARCTSMPVVQIEDGLPLRANQVHVLPPGFGLGLGGGALRLHPLSEANGLVIDTFFGALADSARERAVAVVLSGQGMDGTRGVRAIKAQGGRVLVEDPRTAEYADMPASAVATGLADAVLPALALAAELLGFTEQTRQLDAEELALGGGGSATLDTILDLIRARTGHDFTHYKHSTLIRRTNRRMQGHGLRDIAQYVQLLRDSPDETGALFQDFTINVTGFFRDVEAFEELKTRLRDHLRAHKQAHDTVRVWVAACSTGEEAYSVAIVLHELVEELSETHTLRVQIFATDIDGAAVNVARHGRYTKDIAYVVSEGRLRRYFVLDDGRYQVRPEIRDSVVFATHSTFGDPPFTRLDLLCCRNLLIYVGGELQRQLMGIFLYALRPGGLLFLGASETVGAHREHFTALSGRWKIYRRGEGAAELPPLAPAVRPAGAEGPLADGSRRPVRRSRPGPGGLDEQLQTTLLAEFTPAAVVVGAQGEVLFVHGRTARYLEYPPGRVTNNVFEMVPAGLRHELHAAARLARAEGRTVVRSGLLVDLEGAAKALDLVVRPWPPSGPEALLIIFQERGSADRGTDPAADHPAPAGEVTALQRELRQGRAALEATVEEMAISMEELRRSHEDLQTTNEELQSSNEELMTSKEELQSLNEELSTINAEHQRTIQDQMQANDDIRNLLEHAGTATVFLGRDLTIKRFTPTIRPIVRLTKADEGRPLSDLNVTLRSGHLLADIGRVLETLEPYEAQVQTHAGEWFLMRVSPYRTFDNRIDGVVLAFTNIGLIKALEWRLVESLSQAESVLGQLHDPLVVLDQYLRAVTASRALLEVLGTLDPRRRDPAGPGQGAPAFDLSDLRGRLRDVIASEEPLSNSLLELGASRQRAHRLRVEAELLVRQDGHSEVVQLKLDDLPDPGPDGDRPPADERS